jgi:hypothetical protein
VHLSHIAWVSVSLGVLIACGRLALVYYVSKSNPRQSHSYFNSWNVFGSLVVFVTLPPLLFASCREYFYVYWLLGLLYLGFEFAVIYELIVNALKPYSALIDLGRMIFLWAAAFLLIASVITAITTIGTQSTKLEAVAFVIERSLRLIECGILMLFFLFEKRLGLVWRSMNVAVAAGMGITSAVDLCGSYLRSTFPAQSVLVDCVYSVAFIGVLGFWAMSLVDKKQAENVTVLESPSRLIFQRWNESLAAYGLGEGALVGNSFESFLPSVERTVERVMARKMVN